MTRKAHSKLEGMNVGSRPNSVAYLGGVFGILQMLFIDLPILCVWRMFNWMVTLTEDGKKTFMPSSTFPWATELESNWQQIRSELDAVAKQIETVPNYIDIFPTGQNVIQDDKWKAYVFYAIGKRITRNYAECPETARALDKIPGLQYAMYSILQPKKHIPPHKGYYRGVLNCHLPLVVPGIGNECRIRVNNDIATWKEGRLLIFDDCYEHEAWNDADSIRAVLLMYVTRPLPFPLAAMSRCLSRLSGLAFFSRATIDRANRASEMR